MSSLHPPTARRVLAIDPATRHTGVAYVSGSTDTITCPTKLRGDDRLDWWAHTYNILVHDERPDVVVYEAPFIHRQRPASGVALVELHVKLRDVLRVHGIVSTVVPPSLLKQRATGKGNAGKPEMIAAARALGWDGDGDDQADAWLLWHGAHQGWWVS